MRRRQRRRLAQALRTEPNRRRALEYLAIRSQCLSVLGLSADPTTLAQVVETIDHLDSAIELLDPDHDLDRCPDLVRLPV